MKRPDESGTDGEQNAQPFAEKFGLIDQGIPASICPGALDTVMAFVAASRAAVAEGEEYRRKEMRIFNRSNRVPPFMLA
jgi:hypothetical protein